MEKEYVGYEYKEICTNRDMEGLYADSYPSFGWELEGRTPYTTLGYIGNDTINLKFKRDRKIKNKMELTRMQRQFENYAEDICNLEKSKNTPAIVSASILGVIGAVMFALSVFLISGMLSASGYTMPLVVVTGVIGILLWAFIYPVFKKEKSKGIAKANPIIEQRYDSVNEVCEKAHALLVAE